MEVKVESKTIQNPNSYGESKWDPADTAHLAVGVTTTVVITEGVILIRDLCNGDFSWWTAANFVLGAIALVVSIYTARNMRSRRCKKLAEKIAKVSAEVVAFTLEPYEKALEKKTPAKKTTGKRGRPRKGSK